ncbi:YrdB family protein [Evansella cellulosilytica]|uniref:DUF2568 domain-containing protein n=1 Tax=Evansella cellulosilytica (strain ATCC 21833 / DSM 2522 / FERM P-1141 / JCM 9156 / N-4) TaxID=649639 RepID=E6TRR2_EVAC2|nr:YrdB family protein [Evansella cellulosilytica]ADU29435.1 hypothetical protein Bcell_1170 [Evansella cellulosilytica DSM 2522]
MNLVLRFLLEVCAIVAVSYWGFVVGKGMVFKILLGIGTPLLIMIIWGLFGSPAAQIPLTGGYRLLLEIAIFGCAILALLAVSKSTLAFIFGALVIVNKILMYVWNQ